MKRDMIYIDDEKCDGCGACIPNCPEGAIQVIDGKARLVGEALCDGLGACVGFCPRGAMAGRPPPGSWALKVSSISPRNSGARTYSWT